MSNVFTWLARRERALRQQAGDEAHLHRSIYTAVEPYSSWNKHIDDQTEYGGVYNLEFSPDGSLLVAACEKKSIVLFDPITTRQTKAIKSAHLDCVNCIKFINDRMFATCSDDTTIALWDTRNLKQKMRSLHGHMNWVKNIEYSHTDRLLVTSGFDGSVFTWDINSHTEQGLIYQKVFHMSGLMRCRISPDASKMVISTTGGYMIIVHNLDLSSLAKDLAGFRPNIYRLMQMGHQYIPYGASFDHIFSHSMKRNRVEFASDFPDGNDAEVICSLQIHPQGWCALSRNISYDDSTEWTTVHDIQEQQQFDKKQDTASDADEEDSEDSENGGGGGDDADDSDGERTQRQSAKKVKLHQTRAQAAKQRARREAIVQRRRGLRQPMREETEVQAGRHPDIWQAEVRYGMRNNVVISSSGLSSTTVFGISSGVLMSADTLEAETGLAREAARRGAVDGGGAATASSTTSTTSATGSGEVMTAALRRSVRRVRDNVHPFMSNISISNISTPRRGGNNSTAPPFSPNTATSATAKSGGMIIQNVHRMLNYIQEPNKGKGFIKELCFSADGRLICSPYGLGIRLLAFSEDCAELPKTLHPDGHAQPLTVLKYIKCHSDIVVSTKFSPRMPLLASGCLMGKVVWHQPVF